MQAHTNNYRYFMRKSQAKAKNGKNAIKEVVTGSPVAGAEA
jgi:hypothetical protein